MKTNLVIFFSGFIVFLLTSMHLLCIQGYEVTLSLVKPMVILQWQWKNIFILIKVLKIFILSDLCFKNLLKYKTYTRKNMKYALSQGFVR